MGRDSAVDTVSHYGLGSPGVVSQGTGGRILLKTEWNLLDGSVRTLKK